MRFLIDAQLPAALARRLVACGHEAEYVADCGLREASDSRIWQYALEAGATIVTKDEDFAARRSLAAMGPTIVWVRKGNVRNAELLDWFAAHLPDLMSALSRSEVIVELY